MAMMKPMIAKHPAARRRRRGRRTGETGLPVRTLSLLPTLMTLGNLICGFAAIHFAMRAVHAPAAPVMALDAGLLRMPLFELMLPSFLSVGAGLILLGMVFDMFDGLLARVTRSTTNFGGQLDSLADVVTFGVAPATLMVALMMNKLAGDAILPSPISASFLGRLTWLSAALYVAFTAIRLARFNVEHAKADFDHHTFHGIPSPGAACVMAAMILCHDQPDLGIASQSIVYALPVMAVAMALLMVSRIHYRRFHRTYFLGRKPFSHIITLVIVLAVFWLYKAPVLLLLVMWYAASGPVFHLLRLYRQRTARDTLTVATEEPRSVRKGA